MINKIKSNILPVLAIIGMLLSIELTIIYFNANFVSDAAPSFCAINDTIDCDAVARTAYSHFLGLPLSLWGLGLYSFILFLSSLPLFNNRILKEFINPKSYIFTVSSISVIISIILSVISALGINKICILCVITYLLNICILFASKKSCSMKTHYKNTFKDIFAFLSKPSGSLTALIIVGISAVGLFYLNTFGVFVPKSAVANDMNNPPHLEAKGNILGSKKPKLVIHEYTDFQCPYCSMSHAMMVRLVSEVPQVQIVHHDYPLNKKCNPVMKNSVHKDSCTAALYSRAAKLQGKYWELNGKMFDNQEELSEATILKFAKEVGLNINKLKKDANSPNAKKQLIEDAQSATKMGIKATPTFFIGMQKYEGIMPYPELKSIVVESVR
jgi:protein-disulfide isomerase